VKLSVVAVGRLRDSSHKALCADYAQRLSRLCSFSMVEVKDVRGVSPQRAPLAEAERLLLKLQGPGHNVALDEHGRALSSEGLAKWLQKLADSGVRELRLVVGGPYGLAPSVRERCVDSLRLSSMTFPHELARTVLLEQLYRAHTILAGRPYHNP
jgi:23S rRNA (pseudouridine1915-N3)-methyltransferase